MILVRLVLLCMLVQLSVVEALERGPEGSIVEQARSEKIYRGVVFAEVDGVPLSLDLYLPKKEGRPHLVVFFHGGSWRSGSKESCQVRWLVRHGYAVASVGYRKSHAAKFPVILHDCKGAIRFLRAHADVLGFEAERVAVAGASAGGHLALLLATSGGVKELEGRVGGNLDQSSRVQMAIGMYCPTDLEHDALTAPQRWDKPASSLYQLLGGKPSEKIALARLASVTNHISSDDPPVILLVGGADKPEPVKHGQRLKAAYDKAGLEAVLQVIPGAGHGGPEFRDQKRVELILGKLKTILSPDSDNS
ncbi:MAG: alpha/beta hydrolase [Roseibacillus sp. TMED18]|nr:MAG: alpha/beta hydrolase [Roseibacillus sp. TMED18]